MTAVEATLATNPSHNVLRGGTRPHMIYPHGKALRFEVGGKVVFAKYVRHPGTRPNPFHVRAAQSSLSQLVRAIGQAIF